jgi:hypothetical protein
MSKTFAEIAEHSQQGESDIDDASFALILIGQLAEAMDEFATEMRGHVHQYVGSTENYMQGVVGRPALTGEPVVFQEAP